MPESRITTLLILRSSRRVIGGVGLSLAFGLTSVSGGAEPNPPMELEWQSPADCPQRSAVIEQIRRLLGAPLEGTSLRQLRAQGVIIPIADGYQLTIELQVDNQKRSRVIRSATCQNLGDAAAVVLGLLLRKELRIGRALTADELVADWEPANEGIASRPDATELKDDREAAPQKPVAKRHWYLQAMGPVATVDYWTLPDLGLGFGVAAGFVTGPWHVFLSGTYYMPQSQRTTGILPYDTRFRRQALEAWGCRGVRSGAFEVAPCALIAVDFVRAQASGDTLPLGSQSTAFNSLGGGVAGFWHLSASNSLLLTVTGRVMTARPIFLVDGMLSTDVTHSVPAATIQTSIGSEWTF